MDMILIQQLKPQWQFKMHISHLVALSNNSVIGVNNDLPWTLKRDLKHFSSYTQNKAIVMGRKTFDSIGRPLPNRQNIVISSSMLHQEGIEVVRKLKEGIAAAEKELSRLEITAPFKGLLEAKTAELGSLLQPGSLCATIIQLDPIKLVAFVPETEVNRIEMGAPAGGRLAAGGDEIRGVVTFLSHAADPTTRTFRVEIEVPNPDLTIRDGQTAEILIGARGTTAHLLPQSALTLNNDGALGLRVIDVEGVVSFQTVQLLRDTVDGVWLTGLPEKLDVIVVVQEYVTAGVKVDPTFRELDQ